jgi:hypothetical protein
MSKQKWLSRSLFYGPFLSLVTSQTQFQTILKKLDIKDDSLYCNINANATTHTYIAKGDLCCVVGIDLSKIKNKDGIEIASLLVHEAVHVWQNARSQIVEWVDAKRTGGLEAEMEAYAIQNISSNLMKEYFRIVNE